MREGKITAARRGPVLPLARATPAWHQPATVNRLYARRVPSEKDLANAVEAISEYVAERGAERPKVEPPSAQRRETT